MWDLLKYRTGIVNNTLRPVLWTMEICSQGNIHFLPVTTMRHWMPGHHSWWSWLYSFRKSCRRLYSSHETICCGDFTYFIPQIILQIIITGSQVLSLFYDFVFKDLYQNTFGGFDVSSMCLETFLKFYGVWYILLKSISKGAPLCNKIILVWFSEQYI